MRRSIGMLMVIALAAGLLSQISPPATLNNSQPASTFNPLIQNATTVSAQMMNGMGPFPKTDTMRIKPCSRVTLASRQPLSIHVFGPDLERE